MKNIILSILIILIFTCGCTRQEVNNEQQEDVANVHEETVSEQLDEDTIQEDDTDVQPYKIVFSDEKHPIDVEQEKCISKVYSTQDINNCTYEAMDKWYKEIDKYLALLKTVTTEEDYENILKSHNKWKEYQETEFTAVSIIADKQGTMFQNSAVGTKSDIVKLRALELQNLYSILVY